MAKTKMIGTILPNYKTLAKHDAHADKVAQEHRRKADRMLSKYRRIYKGGEDRYYDGDDKYAVLGRDGVVRWFSVHHDANGEYSMLIRK